MPTASHNWQHEMLAYQAMSGYYRSLGSRICCALDDRGLTQRKLADAVGLSYPEMSRVVHGTLLVEDETLQRLLRWLYGDGSTVVDGEEAL